MCARAELFQKLSCVTNDCGITLAPLLPLGPLAQTSAMIVGAKVVS
jgi:hypothetical protein